MTEAKNPKSFTIDFSGKLQDCYQANGFDEEVMDEIRSQANAGTELFIIIDTGFASNISEPFLVSDHLNLTGNNPLVGANNPIGQRFPVINDVYRFEHHISGSQSKELNALSNLKSKIGAGLKPGIVPTDSEIGMINSLGADFYCYNLVPATIVAAHAGKKVVGVIVPPKMKSHQSLGKFLEETN